MEKMSKSATFYDTVLSKYFRLTLGELSNNELWPLKGVTSTGFANVANSTLGRQMEGGLPTKALDLA